MISTRVGCFHRQEGRKDEPHVDSSKRKQSMKTDKINIEDGFYNGKLLECLRHKKFDINFNKDILEILQKLCRQDLIKESNLNNILSFTNKEKEILNSIDIMAACSNKEVVARWCDYIQELDNNKRPIYIKISCTNYREIYKSTKNQEYLVRTLQLIRKAKSLFTNELEEIYTSAKDEIIKSDTPYWQKLLLGEFVGIFGTEKSQRDFSSFLEERIEGFNEKERFNEARLCIDSLHQIESLTPTRWHIRKAENFEKEGDIADHNRKPNTYYPNLSEIYLKGLKEINSIGECDDLKQRLKSKVAKTQKENYYMIQSVGVPMTPSVDYTEIYKIISELNIESFDTAFKELVSMPIVPEAIITNYVSIAKSSSSPIMEWFSQTVKIDYKGAKIALATGDDVHLNNARSFFREKSIAVIKGIKNVMDIHKQIDKAFVLGLLEQCNSRFIPKDRVYIYAQALNDGFNNNFIPAAHLLVPQFENSFRHIALQNGIETTKWDNELQHQNIFGGILEKIKDFTNRDLYKELSNFLVESNSNFRNEVSHGLISPILIDHYGSYLWWLTLKMVLETENYFSFIKTND